MFIACLFGQPPADTSRLNQHRVSNSASPAQEPGAERNEIPSLVAGVRSAREWRTERRPKILAVWTQILGKLGPYENDRKWFGDITKAVVHETRDEGTYTRIALDLPIEKDFYQQHLLLLPKNQGPGPFPAVVCWTSSTPDYTAPEQWWGKWLVEHGYVVLTSWSFIRNYRDGSMLGRALPRSCTSASNTGCPWQRWCTTRSGRRSICGA